MKTAREWAFIDCLCACEVTEEFIRRCINGGVVAINKCIGTDETMYQAIKFACDYKDFIQKHHDIASLVLEPDDVQKAAAQNKLGILMGFQNTLPLEYDARLVDVYEAIGVRIIQLTYNYRNLVGVGVMEEVQGGVSEFGREVIHRLNDRGVVIDLSHACEQTVLEALDITKSPLMVSHACCRAIHNTPRNVSDAVLQKLREKNSLIGCAAFSAFIKPGMVQNTLDEMIAHIDHMVEVAGIDNVVIGGDQTEGRKEEEFFAYNYKPSVIPPWPWPYTKDFEATYKIENLVNALVKRGYSATDIHKITQDNFMRLFREVRTYKHTAEGR